MLQQMYESHSLSAVRVRYWAPVIRHEHQHTPLSCSMPLKQLYDLKLDQYSADMGKFMEDLHTGSRKKMTMKEKLAAMNEHGAKESMQLHGLPHVPSEVIEPGIAQLEALTSEHEWHMTIVDVKMTTKQTPQGKKSRFSSMVMVGNLQVRMLGGEVQHTLGGFIALR